MNRSACLLLSLVATAAVAQPGPVCTQGDALDRYRLLKRLSLDLRGHVPSIEEYQSLDAVAEIPAALLQQWLASDDFRKTMRRMHASLFYPNISNVKVNNSVQPLYHRGNEPAQRIGNNASGKYRGGAYGVESCDDVQQTQFDPAFPNQFRPLASSLRIDANGVKHEGWRLVSPYWAPSTQVKVCAFDAQETPSVTVAGVTMSCGTSATVSAACGCGPNLIWCGQLDDEPLFKAALIEQLNRAVDDVTVNGRPYTDLILSTKAWENGTVAHFKRNVAPFMSLANNNPYVAQDPGEQISAKPYADVSWEEIDRGGLHAGVATLPAYLLRFQTARGRANRFRIDFACEHFSAPSIPAPEPGCSETTDDLTARCNCQYCHRTLEPLAARFGLFAPAGTTQMTDTAKFPLVMPSCANQSDNRFCGNFYVTDPAEHNVGTLRSYQFTDLHPEYLAEISSGPRATAAAIIADGSFARCSAERVFSYLMKREIRAAGDESDEAPLLQSLADDFTQSSYSFPALVQKVIALPGYARSR